MKTKPLILLALGAPLALSTPASAQRTPDQAAASRMTESGKILPSRAVEARVVPKMKGMTYMGFEFDAGTSTYRLKFIDGRRVVWVDVDGRTGRILGRSG